MSATKLLCVLSLIFGLASTLPINSGTNSVINGLTDIPVIYESETDSGLTNVLTSFSVELEDKSNSENDAIKEKVEAVQVVPSDILDQIVANEVNVASNATDVVQVVNFPSVNITNNLVSNTRNQIRPGMQINTYAVEITPDMNSNSFNGRLVVQVSITDPSTREDDLVFHVADLNIDSVTYSLIGGSNFIPVANFDIDDEDEILEIETGAEATFYTLVIEYRGSLSISGRGLYAGRHSSTDYLAMNLHPTNARRVFPCLDEPNESSIISFTFNDITFNNMVSNSALEENSLNQFRALEGPPNLWSMAAHNFNNVNVPTSNVLLYIRPGVSNQESQASVAFNYYFNTLNEWTDKSYFLIQVNQNPQLSILALPDVSVDWYGLSMIGIWEPYILMENTCSVKQRYTGLLKMAEALSRQWYGYVIYPENWQFEWVVSGLASYTAWELLRAFQTDLTGNDVSMLDVNTLFITDVLQESLYRDAYSSALTLDRGVDLFAPDRIRDNRQGIMNYKAPSLFRMMRLILGDESQDFIQSAGRALLAGRSLQTVSSSLFIDAINSDWQHNGNGRVDDIEDFLEPWTQTNGYPLIHVGLRQGGVLVTQERFGFTSQQHVAFNMPITYSLSTQPNFENIHPIEMMEGTMTFNMFMDEEEGDYVLFNVQGQGYYRVNYDNDLWERIIEALEDPDRRAEIHPLNRATLIDDSLNLARAGRIDYDIAFRVVLTMEHETEYAPWKAFIRNMDFLRKRLVAYVEEDEDLDPDIYLRMVRRSIIAFEREIGFSPDPNLSEPAMVSLTRGMVMDHACRSNYQPCIAAAIDWFWDPNANERIVNPNIPADLRPAVYCTMVREGGDDIISALHERLNIEPSMYERVVILESLTCSRDDNHVRTFLEETLALNSPYTPEEGLSIFKAAAASSTQNAWVALNFISMRVDEVRNRYGGHAKLEEAIASLADHMADFGLANDFNIWVYTQNNRLDDSQFPAERYVRVVMENQDWEPAHLDYVYEWIDENDAPTLIVSTVLILASCMIAILNH